MAKQVEFMYVSPEVARMLARREIPAMLYGATKVGGCWGLILDEETLTQIQEVPGDSRICADATPAGPYTRRASYTAPAEGFLYLLAGLLCRGTVLLLPGETVWVEVQGAFVSRTNVTPAWKVLR